MAGTERKKEGKLRGPTERAPNFSLLLDLICDVMIRLGHRAVERARRASDVALVLSYHEPNQVKKKMRSLFGRPI